MKYYVVSENELENLLQAQRLFSVADSTDAGIDIPKVWEQLQQAKAACRARPVPEQVTHFAERKEHLDGTVSYIINLEIRR